MKSIFEKAKSFIDRHARPLDLARWQYHFENGTRDAVLDALKDYQNDDGGFGHGLEADCLNPNSSPIQTWAATEILHEIGWTDGTHPTVQGILRYLASGTHFDADRRQWLNTVPSNNDYPHAIWWTHSENEAEFKYNPTACLAGFFLKYGARESEFYNTALEIAREAYDFWAAAIPYTEQHVTACFIRLYEYCADAGVVIADMDVFKQQLIAQVQHELTSVADKWDTEYVCMPSNFIEAKDSIFYESNQGLTEQECTRIISHQLPDGSYDVPWQWWTDYPEFETAKIWWKADFCIKNLRFLRAFSQ